MSASATGSSGSDDLLVRLRGSKQALAAFEALPPSHRRRWLAFVAEAKRPATRERRIDACLADLAKQRPRPAPAGYSGTPLLRKLGVDGGRRLAILGAPAELPAELAAVPAASRLGRGAGPFDVIVLFARARSALEAAFGSAARALEPAGGLWVAWPKRASGVPTDLTEDVVRRIALAAGLVDNKVCAIDSVWSGLRCVYRVADRPPTSRQGRVARKRSAGRGA